MAASPDPVQVQIHLAQEAFRTGKVESAEARINRLIEQFPDHPDVIMAHAMMLGVRGDQAGALALLETIIDRLPDPLEALSWAAFFSVNLGRLADAEQYGRKMTEVAPANPRSYYVLASALRSQDRIQEALTEVDKALELEPNAVDSIVLKGRLLQRWQMPALATEMYKKAMALRPNPPAGMELAKMLIRDSHFDAALQVLNQIAPLLAPSDRPYGQMAQSYTLLHRFEEAQRHWALAKTNSPDPQSVSQSEAAMELAAGRFEVAKQILDDLVEKGYDLPKTFSIYVTSRKLTADDEPVLTRMENLLTSGSIRRDQAMDVNYALGKSFDDLGDYEKAIRHYDEANRIAKELFHTGKEFDRDRAKRFTDFLIEISTPERLRALAASGNKSDLALFVVGMMRSGTTLTETILGAHSKVTPGGEQAFWTERVIDFIHEDEGRFYYEHDLVAGFAKEFLSMIEPKDSGTRYVVDKNPGNIDLAGILHTVLPNSKFIHVKRHPVDNLLSLWMTPVSGRVRYAFDRSNLVFTYREYLRLWSHWEEVLPADRFQTFRYEDLTSNPVPTISGMLDFLELETEEACFAPEKNQRTVLTPSVFQVRQPINTGSQARWKKYEPWLGEFAELLDDPKVL